MTAPKPDLSLQHRLYAARGRIERRLVAAGVDADKLERVAAILETLSDADLVRLARYAEGLAEWPLDVVGSGDGPQ